MEQDKEIIEAVQQGDRERFAELIERHQRMVYAIGWSYLGDADSAEDAAQETFIKAYRYLRALRDPSRFAGWLARIARNVSTSMLRRRRSELDLRRRWLLSRPPVSAPPAAGAADNLDKELHDSLSAALAELAPAHRECLVLFYLEGKSIREGATAIGIREEAMRTRLHRARRALRVKMEDHLGDELRELAPRRNLAPVVMPLLPIEPIGLAWAGGSSVASKALSWFGALPAGFGIMLWMWLSKAGFFYLLLRWFAGMESANLIQRPENDFRRARLRRNARQVGLAALLIMLSTAYFGYLFSPLVIFQILSIYTVVALMSQIRILRINCSAVIIGQLLTLFFMLVANVLIGFFHAPFTVFIIAMLLINVMLYWTNRELPRRQDYNLFLRQAKGLLPGSDLQALAPLARPLDDVELRAFAKFMGTHWLARDYRVRRDKLVLRLPPVDPSPIEAMLMLPLCGTSIEIGRDGSCRARISAGDARALSELSSNAKAPTQLRDDVEHAVSIGLREFLAGDEAAVRRRLGIDLEEPIFFAKFSESRSYRLQFAISIGATIFALLMFAHIGSWSAGWTDPGVWKKQPVSVEMARSALEEWISSYSQAARPELLMLWQSPAHPSLELIGPELADRYRDLVLNEINGPWPAAHPGRIFNALNSPHLLYHTLTVPLLSREELATLGFDREGIRGMLRWASLEERPQLFDLHGQQSRRSITMADGRNYRALEIESLALRLRILAEFDALDKIDREAVAGLIARHQVGPGFELPEGFHPLDIEQASGLFNFGVCGLSETWAALLALDALGALDLIDREACVAGILRFYRGRGEFQERNLRDSGIHISGGNADRFFAMESLSLLAALGRVEDLKRWQFSPETEFHRTASQSRGQQQVTPRAWQSLAFQENHADHVE